MNGVCQAREVQRPSITKPDILIIEFNLKAWKWKLANGKDLYINWINHVGGVHADKKSSRKREFGATKEVKKLLFNYFN